MGGKKQKGESENGRRKVAEEGEEKEVENAPGPAHQGSSWSAGPLQTKWGFTHCSKCECCCFGVVLLWLLLPHTSSQACHTSRCVFQCSLLDLPSPPHALPCPFPDRSISDAGMSCGAKGPATFPPSRLFCWVLPFTLW